MTEPSNTENNESQITTTENTTEGTEGVTTERKEVAWEQVLPVVQKVVAKNETVSAFGRLLIEAESKKDALKERILAENRELQQLLVDLRSEVGISEEDGWELDLPEEEGAPAYFTKK